jgi:ribonuclease BN (tRNA processing enzyme)
MSMRWSWRRAPLRRRQACRPPAWEAEHPSGAPALASRLVMNGKIVAYTGDTAWTSALAEVAGTDLLMAEAYYRNKAVPYHLRLADIENHLAALASRRIVLTRMSADMLAEAGPLSYECASDGMTLRV